MIVIINPQLGNLKFIYSSGMIGLYATDGWRTLARPEKYVFNLSSSPIEDSGGAGACGV